MTSSTVRKRRWSSGDLRLVGVVAASPIISRDYRGGRRRSNKRGGACSGHRLGRSPSGDTHFDYCALRPLPTFGGQPCVDCVGSGVAENQFGPYPGECQVVRFSSTRGGRFHRPDPLVEAHNGPRNPRGGGSQTWASSATFTAPAWFP